MQGETGTPFELIGRDLAAISIFRDGPIMVCPAAKFETGHLIEVLAPSLLSQDAGTLIVTGVESLTAEQQKILHTLMTSRDMFLPFARRFRLVLAATTTLSDLVDNGAFDENLYYKISSLSVEVPALRDLRGDILLHVRQLLDQQAAASKAAKSPSLSTATASWLEEQAWPGNYVELSRTLQLAFAATKSPELRLPDLEAALRQAQSEAVAAAAVAPVPTVPVRTPIAVEETLPPFAIRAAPVAPPPPALAAPSAPATVAAPIPIAAPVFAAPPVVAVTVTTPKPAFVTPKRVEGPRPSGLTARSVFRPASGAYDFSRRLAESLAVAEAASL